MKYDLPTLNCLPSFEAAARKRSFTKAAEELCVTQAAISFQVRNLEKSLGVELFVRQHRQLELTRAGEDLHQAVKSAFDRLAAEKTAIIGRKPNHTFTISAPVSFCSKWLVPRLHRLYGSAPGVTLLIDANDSVLDIDAGSVDLSIRYCKAKPPGVDATLLIEDTVFPICSPLVSEKFDSGLGPQDLAELPLLHDQMIDVTWADWFNKVGTNRAPAENDMSFSHTSHAIDAAISGRGLALGRLPLVVDDLKTGRLVRPFRVLCDSQYAYYLLKPHRPRRNLKLDRIVTWLLEESNETRSALS